MVTKDEGPGYEPVEKWHDLNDDLEPLDSEDNLGHMCTPWSVAHAIGQTPYQWQLDVMADVVPTGSRTSVKAANGSGKTSNLVAPLVLWHALAFKNSTTVLTSAAWRQVREQIFTNIRMHSKSFPGWKFNDSDFETPTGSRCIGFSTDDPGKFEGWHSRGEDGPLMIVIDEAKTVKDQIFEARSRCQPDRELLISSPGPMKGKFYESFTKNSHLYNTHTITAFECPHISSEWVSQQIEEYGEGHPLIRSMIYGEFMEMGEDGTVIPLPVLERCLNTPMYENQDFEVHAFCDFAAGGDENVLALRRGNKIEIIKAWHEKNTMSGCGQFITMFNELKLKPEWISADAGGMGKVWCDRFDELGWPVNRVDFGSKPNNKQLYFNRIAEIWGDGARMIEDKKYILPKNDEVLKQQITSRKWDDFLSDGRMKLMSKEKMRKEGIGSPDRAEAVLGCMQPCPANTYTHMGNKGLGFFEIGNNDDFFNNEENSRFNSEIHELGMDVGY